MWTVLVALHAAATWYLVGLIWTIQVVHYPSFSSIDPATYSTFQSSHMTRMGAIVGPPWLVEGLTVLGVFALAPTGTDRLLGLAGGLLEIVAIAVTVLASIPAHEALTRGFDPEAHRRLVRTNWWRTAAWTLRGVLAVVLLVRL